MLAGVSPLLTAALALLDLPLALPPPSPSLPLNLKAGRGEGDLPSLQIFWERVVDEKEVKR